MMEKTNLKVFDFILMLQHQRGWHLSCRQSVLVLLSSWPDDVLHSLGQGTLLNPGEPSWGETSLLLIKLEFTSAAYTLSSSSPLAVVEK